MNTAGEVCSVAFRAATGVYGATDYNNVYPNNIGRWNGYQWTSDCLGFVHIMANPDNIFCNDRSVLGGGATLNAFVLQSSEIVTLNNYCSTKGSFPKYDLLGGALLYKDGHVGLYIGNYTVDGYLYNSAESAYGPSNNKGWRLSYVDLATGAKFRYAGGAFYNYWTRWGYFDHIDYSDQSIPLTYTIRDSMPVANNLYYINQYYGGYNTCGLGHPAGRPYTGSVLPNCTGYAQGRALEIYNSVRGGTGNNSYFDFFTRDAQYWVEDAVLHGMSVGFVPRNGAIMCWKGTYQGEEVGHVCVVEEVMSAEKVYISESHWYTWEQNGVFDNRMLYKNGGNWDSELGSGWTFLGFIYNPAITDDIPAPTPTPVPVPVAKKKMPLWMMLRNPNLYL